MKPDRFLLLLAFSFSSANAGTFSGLTEVADANLVECVTIGDLNNDGKPDIVFTSMQKLAWVRNLGGGAFADAVVIDSTYESPLKVILADMDKDGDLDIVVNIFVRSYETGKSGINIYKNTGNGTFLAPAVWDSFQNNALKDFDLSDFDGDGSPDVVKIPFALGGNSGAFIELNSGDGERKGLNENYKRYLIDNRHPYPQPRNAHRIAIGNFDGDTQKDIIIGSSTQIDTTIGYGAVDAMRNQGAGVFTMNTFATLAENTEEPYINSLGFLQESDAIWIHSIKAANIDRLGSADIIADQEFRVATNDGYYYSLSGIYWWPNKGTFFSDTTEADQKLIGLQNRKIYAFTPLDFDQDGDDDVVAVYGPRLDSSSSEFEIQLLINDGVGNFALAPDGDFEMLKTTGGLKPNAIAAADVNADGDVDFVLGGGFEVNGKYAAGIRVYLNERVNPSPFAVWTSSFNLTGQDALKSADPDNDGNDNETEFADGTNPVLATSGILRLSAVVKSGNGMVTVSPIKTTYTRGETVTVTATSSAPYLLRTWSGGVSGKTNPLVLTMNRSYDIKGHFGIPLEPALEAEAFNFTDGGDGIWSKVSSPSIVGGDSAQSALIDHNESSSMRTTLNGPGTVKFWWRCDSSVGDFLYCRLDGDFQFKISGTRDWEQKTVSVSGPGNHVVEWAYEKNPSISEGSDAGWVDGFEWIPQLAQLDFSTWASAATLTGNDALPLAIPHHDGVANFLKYAFNMNGNSSDNRVLIPTTGTAGLPSITRVGSLLRFEFVRRKNSGLIYTPKKGTNLLPGSWSNLTASPTVTSIDEQWERVIYDEPVNIITTPTSFGRVEVSLP